MRCPKCNSNISFKQRKCDKCGEDVKDYRKIISASNRFYNDGLTRARVRDLSGAIVSLKKSLELDKTNTNARNLLGLCYFEVGEVVSALSEWVISKHFQPDQNIADKYVSGIQANPSRLENTNQLIKKYNQSLNYAKQNNEDLAIIQLKKVTSLNPKFVRAQQLLALLYIKAGEYDKAHKCLKKAQAVDINNTTTIRYMNEVKSHLSTEERSVQAKEKIANTPAETTHFRGIEKFQDDKPNIWVFINLIIGAVIGIAFAYFLIVPQVKKNVVAHYKDEANAKQEAVSAKETQIQSLEQEIKDLNDKIAGKDKDIQDLKDGMIDEKVYDSLFDAISLFQEGKKVEAAEALSKVKVDKLTSTKAKNYYNTIKDATFENASNDLYNQGKTKYNYGRYDEALELFERAVTLNSENVDAIYFTARAYDRKDDKENAKKYYNQVINDFADSSRASEAKKKLQYMGE